MRTFTLDLAIDWADCDPAGIVFYPQFFRMMNTATHAMFGAVGLPFHEMVAKYRTVGVPMLDVQATFRSPAKLGERVRIESGIAEWRDKTFIVRHVMKKEERVVFEAREVRVWAVADAGAANGMRAVPIPAELKALFSA